MYLFSGLDRFLQLINFCQKSLSASGLVDTLLWDIRPYTVSLLVHPPGVRIVVASPVFPKKVNRGRKETGRAVLF
ncbi:hypothetical protein K4M09_12825, partial [Pseudomonas syringae pv. tomato]|nr:hypothetical protein [Pseudomonas syringae pv. tomato]